MKDEPLPNPVALLPPKAVLLDTLLADVGMRRRQGPLVLHKLFPLFLDRLHQGQERVTMNCEIDREIPLLALSCELCDGITCSAERGEDGGHVELLDLWERATQVQNIAGPLRDWLALDLENALLI